MDNGYSICFNEWALDKDIKNELGLLMIISSLCAEKGYCYAGNKYLSNLFNINEVSISRKIKLLEEKKYITIEYEYRGCEIISRKIRLTKMLIDNKQKCKSTINKNIKDNNTSINNTINNSYYNIERYIEENFARTISPVEYEKIEYWKSIYSEDIIKYAIDISIMNNKKTFSYINAIINNWKTCGYGSLDEIKEQEKPKSRESKLTEEQKQLLEEINDYDWFEEEN